MTLKIDITLEPPTPHEIEAEKARLQALRRKKRIYAILKFIGFWVCFIFFCVLVFYWPDVFNPQLKIYLLVLYPIVAIFPIFSYLLNDDYFHTTDLSCMHLNDLDIKECPTVLEICMHNSVVAIYQQKVATQGRSLTNGEGLAIRMWHNKAVARKTMERENAARQALTQPVLLTEF